MASPPIDPGLYWIELEGIRIKVRVIGPCPLLSGWCNCTSERSGVELIVPEHAIRSRVDDAGGNGEVRPGE